MADDASPSGPVASASAPTPVPPRRRRLRVSRATLLKILACGALAVGLYALLGFELAPRILRRQATEYVREEYGRTLRIGEIRVHPFKLYVEIKDVVLPDADGRPLAGFARLFVDFQAPASLWEWAYVFREVTLERPTLRVIKRPDGQLNLADLAAKPARAAPEEKAKQPDDEGPPALWIQALGVQEGQLAFTDRARSRPFEQKAAPVSFALTDFRTSRNRGAFGLEARGAGDSRVVWQGDLSLGRELSSTGQLAVYDYPLATVAAYLGDTVPFAISRGVVDLTGTYRVRLGKTVQAQLSFPQVILEHIGLNARGNQERWIEIPAIVVSDTNLVLNERHVAVRQVSIDNLSARAVLEPDRTLNLTRLFQGAPRNHPHAAKPARAPQKSAEPWSVSIGAVALSAASVNFDDQAIAPGTRFRIAPIDVELKQLSLNLARPIAVTARAVIEGKSRISTSGLLTPKPMAADLHVRVEQAQLALAQPYLAKYADLTIRDGSLQLDGKLALKTEASPSTLRFEGNLALDDLHTIANRGGQDFVNLRRLEVGPIAYEKTPATLSIDRVVVREPYARIILSSDQKLNLKAAFQLRGATDRKEEPRSGAQAAADRPPTDEQPMAVRIDDISFEKMRINFSDYFIKPNFTAEIQGLHGSVRGLSSDPKSRAQVKLDGKMGDVSPTHITGKLQPFAFDKFTDLTLSAENIELPVFNPYSGRFAGYNIVRGELTTNIHYQVRNRKLVADHKLRIDQLEWGEATESKAKAPLPVKLATVLLRDRNGVISLDIPVQGTLDDPKFQLGPILWDVFKNIIVKAAAAPFELLGSLFKGAEKARFVDFQPGSAELTETSRAGLASLGQALKERPKLHVSVPAGAIDQLDRAGIAEHKYQESLAALLEKKARDDDEKQVPRFDTLKADDQIDVLSKLYEDLSGSDPDVPDAPKPPSGTPRKQAKAMKKAFEVSYLEKATRRQIAVRPEDLDALARQRAETIETAIVESAQVDRSRVLLSRKGKVTAESGKVRFELTVD